MKRDLETSPAIMSPETATERRGLNPFKAVRRALTRREASREEEFEQLTKEVVSKLLGGIAEHGMVSIFTDKQTGELDTELYSAYFTSPKIPQLYAHLWRWHQPPEDPIGWELSDNRLLIEANEMSLLNPRANTRGIAIFNRWSAPPNVYETTFRRSTNIEAGNTAIPRSVGERMAYLTDILATEVDEAAIALKFGSPYEPGATRSSPTLQREKNDHIACWVRDVRSQLPALTQ